MKQEERAYMKKAVTAGGTLKSPIHSVSGAYPTEAIKAVEPSNPYGKKEDKAKND